MLGLRDRFLALRTGQIGIGGGTQCQHRHPLAQAAIGGCLLGLAQLLAGHGHGVRRVLIGVGAVGLFHCLLSGKHHCNLILRQRAAA